MRKRKLLLDTCCAHCLCYPDSVMRDKFDITVYFYGSNIQPYTEYQKRLNALIEYTKMKNMPLVQAPYSIVNWFDMLKNSENTFDLLCKDKVRRCTLCYTARFEVLLEYARNKQFDIVSTTLLYSKYQYHDILKNLGQSIIADSGIGFYYKDFREGWEKGFDLYNKTKLYKQKYCGCVFSEQERFMK
ncbi:epoxyqueuosine reductase QueH [bacterium]